VGYDPHTVVGKKRKPPRKRAARVDPNEVIVYTDETGNTGTNVFDPEQPWFWTGSLLANPDFDSVAEPLHAACIKHLGVDELHGAVLGLPKIESIADTLIELIEAADCYFIFCLVEKTHLVGTKFVDTVMDSGINKAVSPFHYNHPLFRMTMAHTLVHILTEKDLREFWPAYLAGKIDPFLHVLRNVKWRILSRIKDPRQWEILGDAIDWAMKYPSEILGGSRTNSVLDAPNIVAFSQLLTQLQEMLHETGSRVVGFVCDEQDQFGKGIRDSYAFLSRISFANQQFDWLAEPQAVDTFRCPIELISSKTSIGLQVVDVVLWLAKRFAEDRVPEGFPGCHKLMTTVHPRSKFAPLSRRQLNEAVAAGVAAIHGIAERTPLEDKVWAWTQMSKNEEARKARMKEGPDGPATPAPIRPRPKK
jgi:hypothetical protein